MIGWPVAHSLSPRLHGFWLKEHGIDGAFVPLPVAREDFAQIINSLRKLGFAGVSVTVPHKEAAFAIAHDLDDAAQIAGAVNLLVFKGARIEGRNTDALGPGRQPCGATGERCAGRKRCRAAGRGRCGARPAFCLERSGRRENRDPQSQSRRVPKVWRARWRQKFPRQLVPAMFDRLGKSCGRRCACRQRHQRRHEGCAVARLSLDALPKTAAVCDIVYNPLETRSAETGARARPFAPSMGLAC